MSASARRQPGQYGSNGLRTDGTSFNVGNKLGDRPSIRLFSRYNTGAAMSALLSQACSDSEMDEEAPNEAGASMSSAPSPMKAALVEVAHHSRVKTQLDIEWGQRRLLDAVRGNRAREVRAAVEDGADVTKADERGWTPLHVAAHVGKPRMCELLVELGAVRAARAARRYNRAGSHAPRAHVALRAHGTNPFVRCASSAGACCLQCVDALTKQGETAADIARDTELAQHLELSVRRGK